MNRKCTCHHCTTPAAAAELAEPQPIDLPAEPAPIRVHTADCAPFDCTLHPDGTLTAVFGGEVRRNFLTLAEMRERNWARAFIEFHPAPLVGEHVPELVDEAVQDGLIPVPSS